MLYLSERVEGSFSQKISKKNSQFFLKISSILSKQNVDFKGLSEHSGFRSLVINVTDK